MVELRPGDKGCLFGWFGTGKTSALGFLGTLCPAALIFDPSGRVARHFPQYVVAGLDDMHTAIASHRHVVVDADANAANVERFASLAEHLGGWFVGVDELGQFLTPSNGSIGEAFGRLWRLGHKNGVTVFVAGHRATEIPAIFRGAEHLFQFRTDIKLDLRTVADWWGDEWAEAVEKLPPFGMIYKRAQQPPVAMPPVPLAHDPQAG